MKKSHLWQNLAEFFLEWEMFQLEIVETRHTFSVSVTLFRKSCHLWDNVEKCDRGLEAADDNMAVRFMLD
jgi:hypothetical protein